MFLFSFCIALISLADNGFGSSDILIGSYIRVAINIWFFIDDLSIIDHKNVSVFQHYHYSISYTQNQSKYKENDL